MNCITYSVKEGNTGVLYLTDQNGNTKIYQPNCDLDKTQKYLYEYHDLITQKNTSIKDSFIINKVDWYSTSVSMVYWQFFFQYVKYEQLIEDKRVTDFRVICSHQESLHSHDAISVMLAPNSNFSGDVSHELFSSLIHIS